ncbi:hypothetical protein FOB63_002456 [Clavispora lusitaniae]|uniref:NADH dehydrogenase [ubiquinone] 1 alpha subcomplex subunit n=2 Tax=Clavispora lusitaniae TaxID=36911 RepID=C4Y6J7_CLAL4|nr:uncharacterized protein CLUG_03780 [Clavispora lusitaniae ATCC 42720]EEQ39652.1 hypothetical protein CLUG_03780 [Clavispora lusitaniae ATCC 42720]KAF7582375.1 hypothetical protein FOB63_002456 [Clavispora lusitaniae]OVF10922.1 putative NADH-ubiquinone oxidoreductase assembly factor [Clavispora lusitaniae]
MDSIARKYPYWKRVLHKFQARRDIPFRKKFFVGYDLHGNTYWEFTIDGNMQRLRRKLEPYEEKFFKADYFDTVPPQWLQWLRRTREQAPTLQELMNEQIRQQNIKILAQHAEAKWYNEKQRLENENQLKLQAELEKVEKENKEFEERQRKMKDAEKTTESDPWASAKEKSNPIESASIKPRR